MTNDERKKMNAEFTRLPRCLRTGIPMFVAFSFSTGYKRFSSALERKPYPHFYGCDEDKLYDAICNEGNKNM